MPRRFDNLLMQAPAPGGPVDAALLACVRGWCEAGAFTDPLAPLRVASIAPHPGLDAVAGVLDGGHQLARLGRWRGLAWRLRILWREHVAGRPARPEDPWDCGWWRPGALGPARTFRPRRPTLLMVHDPAPETGSALVAALQAGSPGYTQPLRVLLITATPWPGVTALQPKRPD